MERETLKSRLGFILLSAGCAIGIGNVWKFPYMAGQGGGAVLDFEDFLVSNLLLPLGSLVYLLFCVSKRGWGWDNYLAEANAGTGLKMQRWMRGYLTWVLPCIVVFLFVVGIYDKFFASVS